MKKAILFFLFIGMWLQSSAQKNKADSLANLLAKSKDTARVNLLNELTKAYWYYQLDKAIEYNTKALHLADSLSFQKGIAEANRCRGVILSFRHDSTGMIYLTKALTLFTQLDNKKGIAATLNNQGAFYLRQKQYSKALDVLFQSLKLFNELQDKEAIGAVTNQIGYIYNSQFDYSAALEFYLKALTIRREIADVPGTAFTLNRVGDMYFKLNQLPQALDYYQQSFKLAQTIGRNQNVIDAALHIGEVYRQQGNYNEALKYFKISLKAEQDYFGKDSVATSYNRIGQTYMALKNYPLSLLNFEKALAISDKKSMYEKAITLHYISQVYFAQHNFPKALENCFSSLSIAKQNKFQETIKDVCLTLSQVYASMKDYQKAYNYHLQYTWAKDSVLKKDLNQRLAALQQSFDLKNKQTQIDLLSRDKQLQENEISRQKQQRYAFIFGLIIFIVLVIVLVRSNRYKQKSNTLLKEQKEEIQNTLSELKSTQAQLIQSAKMASLGELTAGIAHEIQNPLNFVNNFSEVSTELVDEMNEEMAKGNLEDAKQIAQDLKQNLEKINHHGKRAGDIIKGMLQHSRSSSGVKEPTDINALCDEYLRLSYHGLRAKDKSFNATMKTDFDNSLSADEAGIGNINIIPQDIGRVILNLLTNAFYAVNEKQKQNIPGYEPTVTIRTTQNPPTDGGRGAEIRVSDNGNGIPPKVLDKIFQPFFTTKPAGQGTGLGLSLSYDIVKAHGGELKVETKEGDERRRGKHIYYFTANKYLTNEKRSKAV
ncbi:MAG: tetratricopeptide repeat protein [Bacteroidota bacterium]|nr:tetratricopeptide repeat protein [Bacteroidota bacterium]